MTKPLYSSLKTDFLQWLNSNDEKSYRANQIYDHVYKNRQPIGTITTLPKELLKNFNETFDSTLTIERFLRSDDDTFKWLYKLDDGNFIETVLMLYPDRATVCISSQAGCAMGCTFCATGQAGFDRHLDTAEIVEQVARACHEVDVRVSNIVFMGMGEPLANAKNVYAACQILCEDFGFSARNITVSTVGFVPGMKAMQKWDLPVTLAVSLHTPYDDVRNELIPINKRYPISEVLQAAQDYSHVHSRRVSFEYTAIDNTNISAETANDLGRLLADFKGAGNAHLNVIPLNATAFFDGDRASDKAIVNFCNIVQSYGVSVTIRKNRGNNIDAACGQLRQRHSLGN